MIYPANFEQKIGFDQVRTMLKTLCSFALGVEEVGKMSFSTNYTDIVRRVSTTNEILTILNDASIDFPVGNYYDLREMLSRIRVEGLFLDEAELFNLQKTTNSLRELTSFLLQLDKGRFPRLSALAENSAAEYIPTILNIINSVLDKFGHIKDNASPELAQIRRDIAASQGSVSRALTTILRQAQADGIVDKDAAPTLREGRLVIPVSPMYKRKISGIVHDESATGKTIFIEPTAVVEANNRIRELESAERREKQRILLATTDKLRPFLPNIADSQQFLGYIDFLRAKALFAQQINAISPQIQRKPIVEWQKAVHPLLYLKFKDENKVVVPLDITLNSKQRILLISGPNAGGKSVCLKTVALLQYMLQCGMLIPLKETSRVGLFQQMFIDIGDEQSIDDDLSTYSSHLLNMKYFVRNATPETLVLIDEMGGGTEPQIGGAIAQATLEELRSKGTYGIVTTHYQNLKHYAQDAEGVVNGAMLYDRQQLQPLFQLSIGRPGSSFAIEIAHKIGLPQNIIQAAKDLVGNDYVDYDKHLQDIARDKRYWETKREQIHQQEKRLAAQVEHYEHELDNIKSTRRQIIEQAKQEANLLLQESNATIEKTIREIKESKAEKQQTKQARSRIEKLKTQIQEPQKKQTTTRIDKIKAGDDVRLKDQNINGIVLELNDKKALVAIGDIKTYIALNKLELLPPSAVKKAQKITITQLNTAATQIHNKALHFKSELDVRGMRGDEAIEAVMYFLDDAAMVGATQVRILHGTGNGILRQLIRQYLPTVACVKDFRDEHVDFGGAGITVVELY